MKLSSVITPQTESFASAIIGSFGLDPNKKRASSFAFTSKQPTGAAKAFKFDVPFEFDIVQYPTARATEVRSIASGISVENFILLVEAEPQVCFFAIRRAKKLNDVSGNPPVIIISIRNDSDLERVAGAVRKFSFTSDELTAHFSLGSLYEELKSARGRYFTDRGLFSEWYLKERLFKTLQEHGRNVQKEAGTLFSNLGIDDISTVSPEKMFSTLGFETFRYGGTDTASVKEHALKVQGTFVNSKAVIVETKVSTAVDSLDIRTADNVAPSYLAVSSLRANPWVILTNGRIWRLYSSKVPSSSTNYFELDLEGVTVETDQRLLYFVSIFSPLSFVRQKDDRTELEITYDESQQYAQDIEKDLRSKVFDGQLFLNIVRGVLDYSNRIKYTKQELEDSKSTSLKLLYRLLFVIYAESRGLLPVSDSRYAQISFRSLHERLHAMEKEPDSSNIWKSLRTLFIAINKGSAEHNVPEYDGALFEEDENLDGLMIKNRFLAPALHDMAEKDSKGIDYQNLGVRHLGSLYEALLEYSVRQAEREMVAFKDEILDASYAEDLKVKPENYIPRGELYLSVGGLARKGTGSYYTPDEIVSFLVKQGLEPHFARRRIKFTETMYMLRKLDSSNNEEREKLAKSCDDELLGIRVVDPAMGSGHFLVTAVDEISRWIIDVLKEFPDSPLALRMKQDREEIIEDQRKKGIRLDTSLLTDALILKRMVMKRCVYGVDVNFLAVELAKLSLWLDSFTIGTPLTFLDHHIRCGDSLIGLWLDSISKRTGNETLETWMDEVSLTGTGLLQSVSMPADITKEQVEQSRKAYLESRKRMSSYQTVLDMLTGGMIDEEIQKQLPRNLPLVEKTSRELEDSKSKKKPDWWKDVEKAVELVRKFRAFHWEIEFPDAFGDESEEESQKGFDLLLTNPPWEGVKPDDDDFFSVYYPKFRKLSNKQEKNKIIKSLLKQSDISDAYNQYIESIKKRISFYKQSTMYDKQGSGDTNLWKLFLERANSLLKARTGTLAILLPSGIVTDEGAKELRQLLFSERIRLLFEFENTNGIFDIHRSFKFCLLIVEKGSPLPSFPAAFYLHNLDSLEGKGEQEKFVEVARSLITLSAPNSLSIPEVRNKQQLQVFSYIYNKHPLLGDNRSKHWSVSLVRELDRTNDSELFKIDNKGWNLIEGKNFNQFLPDYEKASFTVDVKLGLERTQRHEDYSHINEAIHRNPRLAFRSIARSTDCRAMIACILPPNSFSPNSATIVVPRIQDVTEPNGSDYAKLTCYITGILNSFVFDFLIRTRISANMNFFYVHQTPMPTDYQTRTGWRIIEISGMLSCPDKRFENFASRLGVSPRILTMKERIELTAELNVLVAKHFGLTMNDFQVVVNSFDSFVEDKTLNLESSERIKWDDLLIRKFNGEVRKIALQKFDTVVQASV